MNPSRLQKLLLTGLLASLLLVGLTHVVYGVITETGGRDMALLGWLASWFVFICISLLAGRYLKASHISNPYLATLTGLAFANEAARLLDITRLIFNGVPDVVHITIQLIVLSIMAVGFFYLSNKVFNGLAAPVKKKLILVAVSYLIWLTLTSMLGLYIDSVVASSILPFSVDR